MPSTEQALLTALQTVTDPQTGRDLVTTKQVKNIKFEGADVSFDVELGYPAKSQVAALRKALITAARTVPGMGNVSVNVGWKIVSHAVQRGV
jgi:ATP-binding protein involved in chromosome partitioning